MNITQLFCREGNGTALTHLQDSGRSIGVTQSELLRRVRSLAAGLHELGLGSESRVLVLCGTRTETIEAILATLSLGSVAIPVSPSLGDVGIASIIGTMRPDCCIFENFLSPQIAHRLGSHCRTFISLSPPDQTCDPRWQHYETIVSRAGAPPGFEPDPDVEALVIHTSGSEGHPKAVSLSHGRLATFFRHHDFLYSQFADHEQAAASTSAIVSVLPLSHLGGLAICLQGLMTGRPVHLMSHFMPGAYLRLIEQAACNVIMLIPSMYRALLKEPGLRTADLSHLRFCIALGEPCSPDLARRIEADFQAVVASAYGMTECLTGIGHLKGDLLGRGVKPGSCGTLCFGEAKLLDAQDQEDPGFGELWVRNPTVHGCYRDEQLNRERLHDGWFRTRDLFFKDAEGHFFHRGRSDDMFVHNGKNIYPVELETMLLRHPGIEQVCAAPIRSSADANIPGVLIRARGTLSEADIVDFAARNGPGHFIPKVIRFVAQFPETGPGKVNRAEVARLLQETYQNSGLKHG